MQRADGVGHGRGPDVLMSEAAARCARADRLDRCDSRRKAAPLRTEAAGAALAVRTGWSAAIRWTAAASDATGAGRCRASAARNRAPGGCAGPRRLLRLNVHEGPLVVVRTAVIDANGCVLALAGDTADPSDGAGTWRPERRGG